MINSIIVEGMDIFVNRSDNGSCSWTDVMYLMYGADNSKHVVFFDEEDMNLFIEELVESFDTEVEFDTSPFGGESMDDNSIPFEDFIEFFKDAGVTVLIER